MNTLEDTSALNDKEPMHSADISKIALALSKAQMSMEPALKRADNPFYKSKYATLADIQVVVKKPFNENELSYSHIFLQGKETTVVCLLMHSSGQWIKSYLTLDPKKQDDQGKGSSITYGKRYTLAGIAGIVCDDDDDGNASCGINNDQQKERKTPQPKKQDNNAISEAQAKRLFTIANKYNWVEDQIKAVLSKYGYEKSSEISKSDYEAICAKLSKPAPSDDLPTADDIDWGL